MIKRNDRIAQNMPAGILCLDRNKAKSVIRVEVYTSKCLAQESDNIMTQA